MPSVLTAVWGMSSLFVQVTVAPTATVSVCGSKTKLSIFTAAFAAVGWSFAVTLDEPANSSIAIISGATNPATLTFVLFIFPFPF
jgi:Na+-transporting methylmalonyl-CoA/oxaloacetate decarboxylase beta subunit